MAIFYLFHCNFGASKRHFFNHGRLNNMLLVQRRNLLKLIVIGSYKNKPCFEVVI